jgi:hypothetical protein
MRGILVDRRVRVVSLVIQSDLNSKYGFSELGLIMVVVVVEMAAEGSSLRFSCGL